MNAAAAPCPQLVAKSGPVSADLEPWVGEVWAAEVAPAGAAWSGVWPPDGAARLLFRAGRARLLGPATRASSFTLHPALPVLGVRFRIGAARAFLGLSAQVELRDACLAVEEWPELAWAGELSQALGEAKALPERFARLNAALLARCRTAVRPCPVVQASVASLADARASASVSDVARSAAGASVRQFHRRFATAVDLSPKQFQRVARFRRCLADALAEEGRGWARRAVDHGYADQSHLIREFRRLCGLAPRDVQRPSTSSASGLLWINVRCAPERRDGGSE